VIFVTVGGQLPFDRLIRAVDLWAGEDRRDDVFAQIGRTAFRPGSIQYTHFLVPSDFRRCLEEAEYVISHAGIGTILTALERGKPLLVVPRQARLGESVNDHQVTTARRFAERGMVTVAFSGEELRHRFAALQAGTEAPRVGREAAATLIHRIRTFGLRAP
jgi:exopolysaccharide biosynthesis glucuronosyltransferase PssE